jgi:hypothetical protein
MSAMFTHHADLVTRYILNPLRDPFLTPFTPTGSASVEAISNGESISKALRRLSIVPSAPLPHLILALLHPLLLNLFLLGGYAATAPHSAEYKQVSALLQSYMGMALSPVEDAMSLVDRIMYISAADGWMYAAGDTGGISIRRASSDEVDEFIDYSEIQARVQLVIEMLENTSSDVKSEVLVAIIRRWLSPVYEDSPMLYTSH